MKANNAGEATRMMMKKIGANPYLFPECSGLRRCWLEILLTVGIPALVVALACLTAGAPPPLEGLVVQAYRVRTLGGSLFIKITVEFVDQKGATVHETNVYPFDSREAIHFGHVGSTVCISNYLASSHQYRLVSCPYP